MEEGAAAVYWNIKYFVEFLDKRLAADSDIILQENVFILLSCMEKITMTCVYVIFHLSITILTNSR